MQLTQELTVGQIAAAEPASVRVFESLGIDYCCGGKRGLADACSRIGVSVDEVIARIAEAGQTIHAYTPTLWAEAPLTTLIRHIVERHHAYIRAETPRIQMLLEKVITRHGAAHPEIAQIRDLFTAAAQELSTHMLKEEQVLFPYIARMEQAANAGQPLPPAFFGSVARPIARMIADHDDAGDLLSEMNRLAGGYTPPTDGCATFRALYQALAGFEIDLHEHVHLENNILFPRALALERGE
jgi:regulator of cell morphogenesis and NO signaling